MKSRMQSFVLVTCLLALFVQTVVYAIDPEIVQQLRPDLEKCAKTLPKCENEPKDFFIRSDVWYCLLSQYGIIDKNGVAMKENALIFCDKLISDLNDVALCKKIILECVEKTNQKSESDKEKSKDEVECVIRKGLADVFKQQK
ncbi:venom allergen 2 isoform X2 [Monomorium pharaonis]|uniref:venom allergen 2 isoform X2 n=1 Tax=Monomorium pharaonis TaxID=307658 RepID=UPI001745F109|nr:venom allergen 2 isoform X2 [Monomorium pharaonis]